MVHDSLDDFGNPDDPDHPATGGDCYRMYKIEVREVDSAAEALRDPGDSWRNERDYTFLADGVVHAALRQFLESLDWGRWRYPLHVLTLRMEMLNALIDAGIPESMLHADLAESETITSRLAGDEVGVRAHMLELRKATWEAARRSYERVDRAAEDLLPRRLHDVYLRLRRRNAGRRQSTAAVKRGGSSGRSSSSAGCLSTTNTRSASTRTIPGQNRQLGDSYWSPRRRSGRASIRKCTSTWMPRICTPGSTRSRGPRGQGEGSTILPQSPPCGQALGTRPLPFPAPSLRR